MQRSILLKAISSQNCPLVHTFSQLEEKGVFARHWDQSDLGEPQGRYLMVSTIFLWKSHGTSTTTHVFRCIPEEVGHTTLAEQITAGGLQWLAQQQLTHGAQISTAGAIHNLHKMASHSCRHRNQDSRLDRLITKKCKKEKVSSRSSSWKRRGKKIVQIRSYGVGMNASERVSGQERKLHMTGRDYSPPRSATTNVSEHYWYLQVDAVFIIESQTCPYKHVYGLQLSIYNNNNNNNNNNNKQTNNKNSSSSIINRKLN